MSVPLRRSWALKRGFGETDCYQITKCQLNVVHFTDFHEPSSSFYAWRRYLKSGRIKTFLPNPSTREGSLQCIQSLENGAGSFYTIFLPLLCIGTTFANFISSGRRSLYSDFITIINRYEAIISAQEFNAIFGIPPGPRVFPNSILPSNFLMPLWSKVRSLILLLTLLTGKGRDVGAKTENTDLKFLLKSSALTLSPVTRLSYFKRFLGQSLSLLSRKIKY